MRKEFENWMILREGKSHNTAYQYAVSIDKVSKHYAEKTGKIIDLYRERNITLLKEISNMYGKQGIFSEFGNYGNGTIRNAIATYVRFFENRFSNNETAVIESNYRLENDIEVSEEPIETKMINFTYERDLQNSLIWQAETLFPGYKIFGDNLNGIEYAIDGKRIDLLLENKSENTLLAIELKAGTGDFRVFGQISMYIGLLSKKFPDKIIKGLIICGEVDESLINACLITDKVDLKTYKMHLSLEDVM